MHWRLGQFFIRSGNYKKVVVVGAEKDVVNNKIMPNRATDADFGDGALSCLNLLLKIFGIMDAVLRTDGSDCLFCTLKRVALYVLLLIIHWIKCIIYLSGKDVLYSKSQYPTWLMLKIYHCRNHLSKRNIDWVIPHQANQHHYHRRNNTTFWKFCRKGHGQHRTTVTLVPAFSTLPLGF